MQKILENTLFEVHKGFDASCHREESESFSIKDILSINKQRLANLVFVIKGNQGS